MHITNFVLNPSKHLIENRWKIFLQDLVLEDIIGKGQRTKLIWKINGYWKLLFYKRLCKCSDRYKVLKIIKNWTVNFRAFHFNLVIQVLDVPFERTDLNHSLRLVTLSKKSQRQSWVFPTWAEIWIQGQASEPVTMITIGCYYYCISKGVFYLSMFPHLSPTWLEQPHLVIKREISESRNLK